MAKNTDPNLENFDLEHKFSKSRKRFIEDLLECIEILNVSVAICNNHKCFLNVIAVQLRLMFCDGSNSLVPRIWDDIHFHPLNGNYMNIAGTYIHEKNNLFNKTTQPITLQHWLEQKLIYNKKNSVTIYEAIRLIADKAGAHVDKKSPIGFMLLKGNTNDLGLYYLLNITFYTANQLLKKLHE